MSRSSWGVLLLSPAPGFSGQAENHFLPLHRLLDLALIPNVSNDDMQSGPHEGKATVGIGRDRMSHYRNLGA